MKKVLSLAVVSILVMSSNVLAASKGTLTINGLIINDTCNININGSDAAQGATTVITMPVAYKTDFTGPNSVGAKKKFDIELSNCDAAISHINMTFSGTQHSADSSAKTLETTGTANGSTKKVGIKMVSQHNGADVDVKFDSSRPIDAADAAMTAGSAKLTYEVRAIQVGADAPDAGNYTTSANYELVYR